MKKYLGVVLLICISGCGLDQEVMALQGNSETETIWTFTQFNVPEEEGGMETHYYYGKVAKSLYEKLVNNRVNQGFILLEDVHYWGNDNLIYTYRDKETQGDILFRIEDIRSMSRVNGAPIPGKGPEQFAPEPAEPQTETSAAEPQAQ